MIDKNKEITELERAIEERLKDAYFADSWEQSGQIHADIKKMEMKLSTLIDAEKSQANGKKSVLGAIKESQGEDKQKPQKSKGTER